MVIITFEMCADYFTGSQAKIIKKKDKVCKPFIKNSQ